MPSISPATRRSVNAALRAAGVPLEFVSTRQGYQYFVYDDGRRYETHSEYICYVSDLPVERWVEVGRRVLADIRGQGENP